MCCSLRRCLGVMPSTCCAGLDSHPPGVEDLCRGRFFFTCLLYWLSIVSGGAGEQAHDLTRPTLACGRLRPTAHMSADAAASECMYVCGMYCWWLYSPGVLCGYRLAHRSCRLLAGAWRLRLEQTCQHRCKVCTHCASMMVPCRWVCEGSKRPVCWCSGHVISAPARRLELIRVTRVVDVCLWLTTLNTIPGVNTVDSNVTVCSVVWDCTLQMQ